MLQNKPHHTRLKYIIGCMLVALVIVSLHHMNTNAHKQEAAVLRAYGN